MGWAQAERSKLMVKYGVAVPASERKRLGRKQGRSRKRSPGYVPLTNALSNTEFYGTIEIGSPPQPFSVILDTGSADLWVAGSDCTTCDNVPLFSPSSSSSASLKSTGGFSITYGSGSAVGDVYTENVYIGGYVVDGAVMSSVEQSQGIIRSDVPVSGIMGLAFPSISTLRSTPVAQLLATQGVLAEPLFSFALQEASAGAGPSSPGGVMTLGGVNQSHYAGEIVYTNLTSETYWLIPLQGVSVGSNQLTGSGTTGNVAIDTGTSLIGAPPEALQQIFEVFPGAQVGTGSAEGFYTIPCDSNVTVSLTFSQTSFAINPTTFNLGPVDSTGATCLTSLFAISGLGDGTSSSTTFPSWIIGDSFLMGVYSVFRYSPPSVGFAALVGSGGVDVVAPVSTNNSDTASNPNLPVMGVSSAHSLSIGFTGSAFVVLSLAAGLVIS